MSLETSDTPNTAETSDTPFVAPAGIEPAQFVDATSDASPTGAPGATPRRGALNDWRVLLAVFTLVGVVESQAFGHLNAFRPIFLQQLGVPVAQIPTWTGVLAALGFVIGLPLLPFWGVWADRYSRKLIIVRSAYIEAVIFALTALSPNVCFLALGRF